MTTRLTESPEIVNSGIAQTLSYLRWFLQPSSEEEVMQIEGIFRHTKLMGLAVFVYFAVGIYAVYGHIDTRYIIAFLVLLFSELAYKIIVSEGFKRADPESRKHRKWKIAFSIGMFYFCIVYGLIALIVFLPIPNESRVVVFAVFSVMACALAATSSFMQRVTGVGFILYVAPVCIALIIRGSTFDLLAALVILLCVINVVLFNRQIQDKYTDVFTLFVHNETLLKRLSAEREVSDTLRLQAEKAVAEKNRFIATASHDLRQPLHAIGLFNHALRHKHLTEASHEMFESMQRSIDSLNTMFDSLLDISRLDANAITPNKTALSIDELFESMAIEFLPECEQKGLTFIAEQSGLWVHTDPALFQRILQNVVANAVKYCNEGHVKLIASASEGQVHIVVEDTGEGIDREQLDLVFNEFHQLGRANGESADPGVGLGLSIVKRLCNLLNNQFELVSEPGVGTCFSVSITQTGSQSQSIDILETDTPDLGEIHVLVIDDDPDIVAGLSQVLRFWQCTVDSYESADAVLSAVSHEEFKLPDIVLCDYKLGQGWNGLQLLDVLLPQLKASAPSVFIISGESTPEAMKILDASAFPVLTKPVRPSILRNAIAHSIKIQS